MFRALSCTEDHPQWPSLLRLTSIPLQPALLEFHLAFVRGLELADLQVNGDQAAQFSVVEEQIKVVIPVVNLHALLAGHKTETHAQFQDERFHLPQNCRLQILLRVGVLQTQEIENVGIAENQVGVTLSCSRN